MAQERRTPRDGEQIMVLRGADDQLAALERLWAAGKTSDPLADENAWQILRRALNTSRRAERARLLFEDETAKMPVSSAQRTMTKRALKADIKALPAASLPP
jgi:hypothetical protein